MSCVRKLERNTGEGLYWQFIYFVFDAFLGNFFIFFYRKNYKMQQNKPTLPKGMKVSIKDKNATGAVDLF